MSTQPGLTPLGKALSFLIIVALLGVGGFVILKKFKSDGTRPTTVSTSGDAKNEVIEPMTETPRLPSAAPFVPKDNVVAIELSEYAGYAGLIAANGGMEPNEQSFFFQKYGFKVKLSLSEEESWPALNSGRLAASATTADVLAAYGRQFNVTVPVQISARLKKGAAAEYQIGSVTLHRTADIDGATAEQKNWHIRSIDLKPAPPRP